MAGGDELKLLGSWLSPFATRVKLALALKGLSYADVEEDLSNKSELLLRSNPVHGKYIDEAFAGTGPSLLPSDPHERAVVRFWASYIDDKMVIPWVRSFRGKTAEEKSEGLQQTFAAVETLEGALRECSKGKGFFGGDRIGLVDVTLGSLLTWAHAAEVMSGTRIFDPARTPLLAAWMGRFDELDVAKAVMPDVDRMVQFKTRQARALAAAGASDGE
ncbi:unnamed protein product [Alopecurus aequalis]